MISVSVTMATNKLGFWCQTYENENQTEYSHLN